MSKKIVIGNWKMNPLTSKEAVKLFTTVANKLPILKKTEAVICAPYIYLSLLQSKNKLNLGAQDVFWQEKGAFTGEISTEMLSNIGVKYVILGHSERRAFGESNIDINKKLKAVLTSGIVPIVCVGDKERDESHGYFNVVKNQIEECLNGIKKELLEKIIIAYEPVWALSTTIPRKDATASDCREMVVFIKKILTDKFGVKTKMPRIIYGGSANDKNCEDFLMNGGVDGLLPGAASLDPEKFLVMLNIAEKI